MFSLTAQQVQLKAFIVERIKRNGEAPSFDEMRVYLGLKSKSGVHRMVLALEARGHIRRLPKCARAIEVVGEAR